MYTLESLLNPEFKVDALINGRWVRARPLNSYHESFWCRLKDAWAVLTRKADAFTWPEGQ